MPKTLFVLDKENSQLLYLPVHESSVSSVAFSPDGEILASASLDGTIRLWNASTGEELRRLVPEHQGKKPSIDEEPPVLTRLPPVYEELCRHFQGQLGEKANLEEETPGEAGGFVRLPVLALLGEKANVDEKTLDEAGGSVMLPEYALPPIAFSPSGRTLASGYWDGTVFFWDVADPANAKWRFKIKEHVNVITSLAFCPADGATVLASGSCDATICLWRVPDEGIAEKLCRLEEHKGVVTSVAFHPEGEKLASASSDGTVRVWDVSDVVVGRPRKGRSQILSDVLTPVVESVAPAPVVESVAPERDGKDIPLLWDRSRPEYELERPEGVINSVTFSPDGRTLAMGIDDKTVRLWNIDPEAQAKELCSRKGHAGQITAVLFAPDGKKLASASTDGTLRLWDVSDVSNIEELCVLEGHEKSMGGCRVNALAFSSPAGNVLASGGDDRAIRYWDVASGKELETALTYEKLDLLEYKPLFRASQVVLVFSPAAIKTRQVEPGPVSQDRPRRMVIRPSTLDIFGRTLGIIGARESSTLIVLAPSYWPYSDSSKERGRLTQFQSVLSEYLRSCFGVAFSEMSPPFIPRRAVLRHGFEQLGSYLDSQPEFFGFNLYSVEAQSDTDILELASWVPSVVPVAEAARRGRNVCAVVPIASGGILEKDAEVLVKTATELSGWGRQGSPILVSLDTPKHKPVGGQESSSTVLPWLEEWVRQAPAKLSPDGLSEILRLVQVVLEGMDHTEREAPVKRLLFTFESWPMRLHNVGILGKGAIVIIGFLNELAQQLRVMLLHDSEPVQHHLLTAFLATTRKTLRAAPDEDLSLDRISEWVREFQYSLMSSPQLRKTKGATKTEQVMWQLMQDLAKRNAGQMRKAFDAGDYENARKCAKRLMSVPGFGWICELGKSGVECPDPEAVAIYCITFLRGKKEEWLAYAAYKDAIQRWAEHQNGHSARERFLALLHENGIEPSCLEGLAREDASGLPEVDEEYLFHRRGKFWEIKFEGLNTSVDDRLGARCIAYLLDKPFKWIHADELHAAAKKERAIIQAHSLGSASDKNTLQDIRQKMDYLEKELRNAQKDNDEARKDKYSEEIRELQNKAESVFRPGGKPRNLAKGSPRRAVSNAINRCIKSIDDECEPLKRHFSNSINMGYSLAYTPDRNITWQVAF